MQSTSPHAAVFMYHRFGEGKYPSTNIRIDQFEEQLRFIEENEFKVVPLEAIIHALDNGTILPDKAIAITIDDAYQSVYDVAYPRLQSRGYPFTVFICPGDIDRGVKAYMDWPQIREMHDNGVTFANHSLNHDYLVRKKDGETALVWAERIRWDLEEAQKRLIEELDEAPPFFAYPYGEYNLELMAIVKELGFTAFGQHSGVVGPLADREALPRFPVAEAFADMSAFKVKALALPMPVVQQDPVDPQTVERRPGLTLILKPVDMELDQLRCFYNGQPVTVAWKEAGRKFTIQAPEDLPAGRSRYNCTAPSTENSRYYWFSHQWIRPAQP
ncbi:polysaccharide deacetylase family protein [Desulfopila sp. IMCC35008]|uniref:polysaccharide deacetylase family protein n=1 Tax=Desulfopila sp. IMCC35008 TaxID=2653858 RepID=UPI0013D8A0A8|nr:polysaccharide deacetylase family protein [Desulfopila sp. IMCC35008]